MCITNEFFEKTLKGIRSFDSGNREEKELAGVLAQIKILQECLEESEEKIKKVFKESYSGELYFYPEISKKVYLSEGRSSTEINPLKVYDEMKKQKISDMFPYIVKIVVKDIDNFAGTSEFDKIKKIVTEATATSKGESYVTVGKMNKKELIEHTEL
jgi:hypothetical protein